MKTHTHTRTHINNYDLRPEGHNTGPKQDPGPNAV